MQKEQGFMLNQYALVIYFPKVYLGRRHIKVSYFHQAIILYRYSTFNFDL